MKNKVSPVRKWLETLGKVLKILPIIIQASVSIVILVIAIVFLALFMNCGWIEILVSNICQWALVGSIRVIFKDARRKIINIFKKR
jgi:hypothetical protein